MTFWVLPQLSTASQTRGNHYTLSTLSQHQHSPCVSGPLQENLVLKENVFPVHCRGKNGITILTHSSSKLLWRSHACRANVIFGSSSWKAMGFVLPHLFSQVYFALDEPVPPCAFFFFFLEGVGGKGGRVWILHCFATGHFHSRKKEFSPLGLKQYFQLLCILLDPYTVSKRDDSFCRCWKQYMHRRLWGLL